MLVPAVILPHLLPAGGTFPSVPAAVLCFAFPAAVVHADTTLSSAVIAVKTSVQPAPAIPAEFVLTAPQTAEPEYHR